ncbi:MAG: 50S ribosomal protein L11 methyltransferase [Candidatus Woesearchaeota archaeon]|jgi:methylase of polypeptide subunit release factors
MTHFINKIETKEYIIKNQQITLKLTPDVFCPSQQGLQFAEHVIAQPHERVLDMGTGTGLLGILAAKQGGIVDVSDTSPNAVKLALENATLNDVLLSGHTGEYFCTPFSTYDYIIANLPQEIITQNYAKKINALNETINGGKRGNEHLLKFLDCAHQHMTKNSRALIAVGTLTQYLTTLQKINKHYYPKLLDVLTSPAKNFVQDNLEEYLPLIEKGEIGLFKKNNIWQSTILIYELRKK